MQIHFKAPGIFSNTFLNFFMNCSLSSNPDNYFQLLKSLCFPHSSIKLNIYRTSTLCQRQVPYKGLVIYKWISQSCECLTSTTDCKLAQESTPLASLHRVMLNQHLGLAGLLQLSHGTVTACLVSEN